MNSLENRKYEKEIKKSSYGVVSLDDRIESINFSGRMLNYIKLGLPIILLTNKENELTKFVTKNKIGVVIGDKSNISKEITKLKNIRKNFLNKNYNKKVILKYFNVKITTEKFLKTLKNKNSKILYFKNLYIVFLFLIF